MVKYGKAGLMWREGGDRKMKTILAALFAVLIGLTFVGSTFADAGKMGAPATTSVAGGGRKKEEGQKITQGGKKYPNKKHTAGKKEEKKKRAECERGEGRSSPIPLKMARLIEGGQGFRVPS